MDEEEKKRERTFANGFWRALCVAMVIDVDFCRSTSQLKFSHLWHVFNVRACRRGAHLSTAFTALIVRALPSRPSVRPAECVLFHRKTNRVE